MIYDKNQKKKIQNEREVFFLSNSFDGNSETFFCEF